jgi:hypothetical protein
MQTPCQLKKPFSELDLFEATVSVAHLQVHISFLQCCDQWFVFGQNLAEMQQKLKSNVHKGGKKT